MKRLFFLFAILLAHPVDAISQTSIEQRPASRSVIRMDQTASVSQPCDYETCALRLMPTMGTWHIVRGLNGAKVGSFGYFRPPNLASAVAEVPDALEMARRAQRGYVRSAALIWGGALLSVAGILFAQGSEMYTTGMTVGTLGVGMMFVGSWQHSKNIDLLSKSIWLYNRALKR